LVFLKARIIHGCLADIQLFFGLFMRRVFPGLAPIFRSRHSQAVWTVQQQRP
jgi:hypothetical protein